MWSRRHFIWISNNEIIDVIVIDYISDITSCLLHFAMSTIFFNICDQWLFLLVLLSLDEVILFFGHFGLLGRDNRCWFLFLLYRLGSSYLLVIKIAHF